MRDPLTSVSDALLARVLRDHWGLDVDDVQYLPWGFGAWHWAASDPRSRRRWFVTADELDHPARGEQLEATYAAALVLSESGLDFVVPCLRALTGRLTHEQSGFALSVTPWVEGTRAGGDLVGASADESLALVRALHDCLAPSTVVVWDHRLPWTDDLGRLGELLKRDWSSGPYAASAHNALRARLPEVGRWLRRHHALAAMALAARSHWVVTHGEPGLHNQLVTPTGRRLVDWESMRVAPRERDLTPFLEAGQQWRWGEPRPDPAMLELFDLHWRLNEIGAYAARFRAPHTGGDDDRIALKGLVEQLERPDWFRAD